MAVFKCKMCGGSLEIENGLTVCECEYCGSKQSLPSLQDENVHKLFNRANALRMKSEFDKAEELYEKILQSNETEAEAYWGMILCKYGIEYVEDPQSFQRIPTCHRASYEAITADEDYKNALKYADFAQKTIYEKEAKAIDEIQKRILQISNNEDPYDVFICYKESDENGKRTQDSVIANDIYYQLTQEGFKVFYAAITLEDKLGQEYEPYIFSALNSAKVMLVLGTKPEYMEAVWVKNEWSRFLKLMKTQREKMLIPCYKDMDAYELPEEFAHLQALDMSKIGFVTDLVRGIKKVIVKEAAKPEEKEDVPVQQVSPNVAPLLKRAFMFLEDEDWETADEYCEKVLDIDPENAEAYLGKLMSDLEVKCRADLKDLKKPFDGNYIFKKVIRFADEKLKDEMNGYIASINERNENMRLQNLYNEAENILKRAKSSGDFLLASDKFKLVGQWKDAPQRVEECFEKWEYAKEQEKEERYNKVYVDAKRAMQSSLNIELRRAHNAFKSIKGWKDADALCLECEKRLDELKKNRIYNEACQNMSSSQIDHILSAIPLFESIKGWKDADEQIIACQRKIEEIKVKEEAERIERERNEEIARKEAERIAKRNKRIVILSISTICVIVAFILILKFVIIPNNKYNEALALMDAGEVIEAYELFVELEGYKDSTDKAESIYFEYEVEKLRTAKAGDYVFFGAYEQDNDTSNGKEAVEWLVLEVDNGKALLVSKYALDCKAYNASYTGVTWETCTLRKWLNDDFANETFSVDEKAMIPKLTISADENPEYSTDPGNATQDQVFLLSIAEVNRYFSSASERQCKVTDYAVAKGVYFNRDNGFSLWWLRSPGNYQTSAAYVGSDGVVYGDGYAVSNDYRAVRPALWINLNY